MATTTKQDDKDTLARLASKGEATLQKLVELPGGTKAVQAFNDLRIRVDDLGRKVRGIDALERRVHALEKEVAALKRAQKAKPAAARKAAPRKSPAP
jgi:hypothetical protein